MQRIAWACVVVFGCGAAAAQTTPGNDDDALSLQADEPKPAAEAEARAVAPATRDAPLRIVVEGALGRIQDQERDTRTGRRATLDLRYTRALDKSWRFGFSDRFDYTHPAPTFNGDSVNSLRELFVGWQGEDGTEAAEIGRINVRQGPAYGYNPTDYFRTGALRTITTADPLALREMRMGTVMLRGSKLWASGGATLAFAPKLQHRDDDPADRGWASLALGETNSSNRLVGTASTRFGERVGAQASALLKTNGAPSVGLSGTALLADALVAHGEWSTGKEPSLLDRSTDSAGSRDRVHQAAVGATYTFPTSLALTVEGEYNGAGLKREQFRALLANGPDAVRRYYAITQLSQEVGSRTAWLVYASQKDVLLKRLDATVFLRANAEDHSRIVWGELRYHWSRFDAVLQYQRSTGRSASEFGIAPYRQLLQVVGVFYL